MTRHLSKSRILSGLQCPKRLWLEINRPELAQVAPRTERLFTVGHEVGALARTLWPGGHLIEHDQNLGAALAETKGWLARSPDTPLFEATLRHEGVLVRTDVLAGPELIEVKASTKVKDHHLTDCAIQSWVLTGAWRPPERVCLAHIDNTFVYPGGADYAGLFAIEDITGRVQELRTQVPDWVALCREALDGPCPEREVGAHCSQPFDCPFIHHCTPPQPDYPVSLFPRGSRVAAELVAEGVLDVRDVPEGRLTKADHERIRRVTAKGEPEISPELVEFLRALPYPRQYIDFETVQFAVPIWAGTRPYEQLPFQWSCHTEYEDGLVDHLEYLDTEGENPLRDFTESLLDMLEGEGPVLIYTAYETGVLRAMQARFPDLAEPLQGVIDRLVDLHPPLRDGYYHPDQHGSWSIKVVAPLIAPDVRYEDLDEVRDGGAAQEAYRELIHPATTKGRKREVGRQLLEYCGLDTLAMVRVVEVLTGRELTYPDPELSTWGPIVS